MKRRILIGAVVGAVFFAVAGLGSLYAYDASKSDTIAAGVQVAGVDVGGLSVSRARDILQRALGTRLARPVEIDYPGHRFFLGPAEAQVRPDVNTMVDAALAVSRRGTFVGRAIRELAGHKVRATLPARIRYSKAAVDRVVRRVQTALNRSPQDATVEPSADNLTIHPSQVGLSVRAQVLRRMVVKHLENPASSHVVHVQTLPRTPKVSTARLTAKYPAFITIDRANFRLRLWQHLKLTHTYVIAVGRQGLETPAGLYEINDREIDPSWHVPNSAWAGALAGKVIPPGPDDPIKARWLGFYNGAGIHGTDELWSLGTAASHGCIRMSIPDVEQLFPLVPMHTPIYVG
jgi:lipoprotein-anchoring transpeptidase ErfK/SrfK